MGFLAKKQKTSNVGKKENMMKNKCYFFEEKTISFFKIASLPN